jgi:hypothetical protein
MGDKRSKVKNPKDRAKSRNCTSSNVKAQISNQGQNPNAKTVWVMGFRIGYEIATGFALATTSSDCHAGALIALSARLAMTQTSLPGVVNV